MKTVFATIVHFLAFIPLTISQMDILACYHKLPIGKEIPIKPTRKNIKKYEIDGGVGDLLPAVVDLKNGYAGWLDNGTGGGSVEVEIAKFKKIDGSQLVVYKHTTYDGVLNTLELKTFSIQKETLVPVADVVPMLTLNDFLAIPDNQLKPDVSHQILMALHLEMSLPRTGTAISCKINLAEAENQAKALPYLKKIKYTKIELVFDKTTGKFKIGKKS